MPPKKPKAKPKKPKIKVDNITIDCAYDKLTPVGKMVMNPRNPHKHSEKQVKKLAMIIQAQDWRHAITVSNRSGFIVSGHCRFLAAKELGMKKVPVDFQDFESEAQEWAILVADNIVQELSTIDGQIMADGLVFLDQQNFPLEQTALEPPQIEDYIQGPTDEPRAEEPSPIIGDIPGVSEYLVIRFEDDTELNKVREALGLSVVGRTIEWTVAKEKLGITVV